MCLVNLEPIDITYCHAYLILCVEMNPALELRAVKYGFSLNSPTSTEKRITMVRHILLFVKPTTFRHSVPGLEVFEESIQGRHLA